MEKAKVIFIRNVSEKANKELTTFKDKTGIVSNSKVVEYMILNYNARVDYIEKLENKLNKMDRDYSNLLELVQERIEVDKKLKAIAKQ